MVLTGVSGLGLTFFSIFVKDILLNFLVAYTLGLLVLIGFSVVFRPIIAKMNAFFFIQNVLAISTHGAAFYFFTDNEEQYPEGPHFSAQASLNPEP